MRIFLISFLLLSCQSSHNSLNVNVVSKDRVTLHLVRAEKLNDGILVSGHIDGIHRMTDKAELEFRVLNSDQVLHSYKKVYAGIRHSLKKHKSFRHMIEGTFPENSIVEIRTRRK